MAVQVLLVRKDDPKKSMLVHSIDAKEILRASDCEWEPAGEDVREVLSRKRMIPTPEELARSQMEGGDAEELIGGDASAENESPADDTPRATRGGKRAGG